MNRFDIKRTTLFLLLFFPILTVAQTNQPRQPDSSKPFVLGRIEEINSAQLAEKRTLNIYLPDGYSPTHTLRYPVIYLLDGSADEDFIHIVGLVQYNNFSWINRVPKSIVVGIANVDRRRDFTYPTTIEADKNTPLPRVILIGLSPSLSANYSPLLTGNTKRPLLKLSSANRWADCWQRKFCSKNSSLFDKYIIVSPSMWWDNGSLLNQPSALLGRIIKRRPPFISVSEKRINVWRYSPGDGSRCQPAGG